MDERGERRGERRPAACDVRGHGVPPGSALECPQPAACGRIDAFEGCHEAAGGVSLAGAAVATNSFAASELCTLKPAACLDACLAEFDMNCGDVSSWVEGCTSHAPAACEP